jgi:hypothetical protein
MYGSRRIRTVQGLIFQEGRSEAGEEYEIIGYFEPISSGWVFVPLVGNAAGQRKWYPSLAAAVNRANRYTPYSNEGID